MQQSVDLFSSVFFHIIYVQEMPSYIWYVSAENSYFFHVQLSCPGTADLKVSVFHTVTALLVLSTGPV